MGFLPAPKTANALFIINRVIDVIFIYDGLIQFVLMKRVDTTVVGSEFEWEMNPRKLASAYFRGVSCPTN